MTFGEYIRKKRTEKKLGLRSFASLIGKSATYVSAIENGDKVAPSDEVLKTIVSVLDLDLKQTEKLYDLAAQTKTNNPIPADITETIKGSNTVRLALRVAKNLDATDEEWEEFMQLLQQKRDKGEI